MATWDTVRELGLRLPETEEAQSYGTPSLKVRGKGFARLRENDVLVVMIDHDEKQAVLDQEPEIFFTTPHYDGYPAVLVRLSAISDDELREVLTESWRRKAPKRVVAEFDRDAPA
jgi:hypothetical protein